MEGVGEVAGNCIFAADLSCRVLSLAVGEEGTGVVGLFGELTLAPSLRISIYTIKSSRTELWGGKLNKME